MRPRLCLLFIALATSLRAEWTAIGPHRGTITAIATAATEPMVIAGTAEGRLFRSTDEGRSWEGVGAGLRGHEVRQIIISAEDAARLWVLTDDGLYRSSDHASTFLQRLGGRITDVAVAAAEPDVLYVATGTTILKSADGGITWEDPANMGLSIDATAVGVDAVDASLVWAVGVAGTQNLVYRSNDGGTTWQQALIPQGVVVVDVATHPFRSGTAFAVSHFGGAYRTTDSETWTELSFPAGRIVFDPSASRRLYLVDQIGRMYRSEDEGDSLRLLPQGSAVSLAIDPRRPETMYAGLREEGILRSDDGGERWTRICDGLAAAEIYGIAVDRNDPNVIYAGGPTVLLKSSDRGENWQTVFSPRVGPISRIAIDPIDSRNIWVGAGLTIWNSGDSGNSWQSAAVFPGKFDAITGVAIDERQTNTVWVSLFGNYETGASGELYRSLDGGTTFVDRGPKLGYGDFLITLFVDQADPQSAWIGGGHGYNQPLLFHSPDGGTSWIDLSAKIAATADSASILTALFVHRGTIFAATTAFRRGGRLLRSDDGGESWRTADHGLASAGAMITSIIESRGSLYASVSGPVNIGPVGIVAGNSTGGVFVSSDGSSWRNISDAIGHQSVSGLAGTDVLFASTIGGGVFVHRLAKARSVR